MTPKKPAAKKPPTKPAQEAEEAGYKRPHTWDDTPENRTHRDEILERANYLCGHSARKLPANTRKEHAQVATWYRGWAAEMKADFAAQKGAA